MGLALAAGIVIGAIVASIIELGLAVLQAGVSGTIRRAMR